MNTVEAIRKLNEQELARGVFGGMPQSWHDEYKHSAWVFVGGLDPRLSVGDVICVLSQWGEIEDIHLVMRDEENPLAEQDADAPQRKRRGHRPQDEPTTLPDGTALSRGFAFVKFEDHRSCILAVDNLNGYSLLGRTLRVDHKTDYRPPKREDEEEDQVAAGANPASAPPPPAADGTAAGHAYKHMERANDFDLDKGYNPWAKVPSPPPAAAAAAVQAAHEGEGKSHSRKKEHRDKKKKHKKEKKERKEKKKEKKKKTDREERRRSRTPPPATTAPTGDAAAAGEIVRDWRGLPVAAVPPVPADASAVGPAEGAESRPSRSTPSDDKPQGSDQRGDRHNVRHGDRHGDWHSDRDRRRDLEEGGDRRRRRRHDNDRHSDRDRRRDPEEGGDRRRRRRHDDDRYSDRHSGWGRRRDDRSDRDDGQAGRSADRWGRSDRRDGDRGHRGGSDRRDRGWERREAPVGEEADRWGRGDDAGSRRVGLSSESAAVLAPPAQDFSGMSSQDLRSMLDNMNGGVGDPDADRWKGAAAASNRARGGGRGSWSSRGRRPSDRGRY